MILKEKDFLFSRAPAKIILSGEHAVVYGCPAVAVAVNRYATTEIATNPDQGIFFTLSDLRTTLRLTLSTLRRVRDRLLETYRRFIEGKAGIREVVTAPADLFQYTLLSLIEDCQIDPVCGVRINVHSTIPIGCGMGSSAATIVSFVKAILHFFHIDKGIEWIEKLILDVERFQHGRASGVDSFISLHGGCARFQKGKTPCRLDMPHHPMWIILTGRPESSTGECVAAVSEKWNAHLTAEFEEVTSLFEHGLKEKSSSQLIETMRRNHQLLATLGVVPEKVRSFISAIEKQGGAAKISGAGSIRGDSGGVVIAISEAPLEPLCTQYGYQLFPLEGEMLGAKVYCS